MKTSTQILLFKICATLLVTAMLVYPFVREGGVSEGGVFGSLGLVGIFGLIAIVLAFLIAIAFYCRALQRCLSLIRPKNRAMRPRAVWLMFALPYNFVEDFFIIQGVTKSLELEAKTNIRLQGAQDFGKITGFTWCTAQIISLIPTALGQVAGGIALLVWLYHWHTITKINSLLSSSDSP